MAGFGLAVQRAVLVLVLELPSKQTTKRGRSDTCSEGVQTFSIKRAGFGNTTAALAITGIMKGKIALGMGTKKVFVNAD